MHRSISQTRATRILEFSECIFHQIIFIHFTAYNPVIKITALLIFDHNAIQLVLPNIIAVF